MLDSSPRDSSPQESAPSLSGPLLALWHDARGEWDEAHEAAQAGEDRDSAWVHAYLHRREGDAINAQYRYRRAGKPVCTGALDDEREAIAQELQRRSR